MANKPFNEGFRIRSGRTLVPWAGAALGSLALCLACGGGSGGGSSTSRTVTGSALVTYLPFNAATGTITPAAPVPWQLSSNATVSAVLADGTTTLSGTYDAATGAVSIPNVPNGNYWLHFNGDYVWTSRSTVNLGKSVAGRQAATDPDADTLHLTVSGLDPWQANDTLVFYDFNTCMYSSLTSSTTNFTAMSLGLGWIGEPLVDTTQGDAPRIVQIVDSANGTVHTLTPKFGYVVPGPLVMQAGQSPSLSYTLGALSTNDSVYVSFDRSQFAAYRSQYNPNATVSWGPFMEFDAQPGAAAHGDLEQWLDGVCWQDNDTAQTADVNLGTLPSPALDPGFERMAYAGENQYMNYTLGNASAFKQKVKSIRSYTLAAPSAAHPLQALVSPVKAPTINGLTLFANQAGVGTTPTLAWTAPDLGKPTAYIVEVNQLGASGGATTSTWVSSLYLPGSSTSLTLPSGILQSGNSYWFLIMAFVDGSYDPTAAPYAAHQFPYGMSQAASNVVTP